MTDTAARVHPHPASALTATSLIGTALIAASLMSYSLWSGAIIDTAENGVLELAQNIFLLLACLLHSNHSWTKPSISHERHWHSGLALLCFALLLREVDINRFGTSTTWGTIEIIVRGVTVFVGVIYAGLVFSRWRLAAKNIRLLATSPTTILTGLGCVAYLSSWPFDKMIFALPGDISEWIEETLELNATILLFAASTFSININDASASKDRAIVDGFY